MFPLKTLWCREVGWGWGRGTCSPGPQGNKTTGETPGETLGRSQDREGTGDGGGLSQQSRWSSSTEGSRAGEWAQRRNRPVGGGGGGGRGWLVVFSFVFFLYVPVSAADAVTKTTSSSPKALTASCGRCYCRRQSNTTVWVRKKERTTKEKECGRRY